MAKDYSLKLSLIKELLNKDCDYIIQIDGILLYI